MMIIQESSSILPLGAISSEKGFTSATLRLCSGLDQRKTELNTFWDRMLKIYDNRIFYRAVARLPAHRLEFNYFSKVSPCLGGVTLWSDDNWWPIVTLSHFDQMMIDDYPEVAGGRGNSGGIGSRRGGQPQSQITLTLKHKQSMWPLSLSFICM